MHVSLFVNLCVVLIQHLCMCVLQKWQSYVEKYSKPEEEASPELRDILANRKVFMKR